MFPRFTIRVALLALAVAAVLSLLVARGLRGDAWAAGVAFGVGSIVFTLLCHAAWRLAAQVFVLLSERSPRAGSGDSSHAESSGT